ncbi:MAG TPA: hypothetical protein PLG17_08365 [Thermodesulfobacteriota bacterium]|nr:hypothetical protein [Deltaproteobacteria bacterium]HNR14221.1 hypothetical protein [Thermodesulfobacteriota bacterium]HNU70605.1 hypothetical protein [Thermodesulfobacteriota bacterium]HQO78511.1 hypothetical protein [Thermodesulfobacteriota bacterium]
MERKRQIQIIIMVLALVVFGTISAARAEIKLTDNLSITGLLRYELGLHTGGPNPNNAQFGNDNNDLNLSRFFFHTELTYQPSAKFKIFALTRFQADTTYHWDGELDEYNAFPVDVPEDDWTMMKASDDDWRAEIWELYADMTFGNLWLRLGRQQIVWGEMIGARILDAANSLDRSWNFVFEPEEFELIRIPNWAIRASYNITEQPITWISDLNIEAYLNPGDVYTTIDPEPGSPYNLRVYPPFFQIDEQDNRGNVEFGVRIGGMIGNIYGTLNYMSLHSDDSSLEFTGFTPDPVFGSPFLAGTGDPTLYAMMIDAKYEPIDLYGLSLNSALGDPFNAVITYEGAWIPNQPYAKAGSSTPDIEDQGTFKYAVRIDRPTQVLPKQFLHSSMATLQFQVTQTIVEGDEDDIWGGGNSDIDKTVTNLTFQFKQPFWHNDFYVASQFIYDTDGAWLIKPQFRYYHGNHWYFDIYSAICAGSEKRPARFGNLYWADTVYGRVTYQF